MFNFSFLLWSSFSYILHYESLYNSFVYFYCLALAWKDNAIGPISEPITKVERILIQPSNNCWICQDSGTSAILSKPQVSQRNKLTLFIFHVRLPSLGNFASRLCTKKRTRGKEKHHKSTCRFSDRYASLASMLQSRATDSNGNDQDAFVNPGESNGNPLQYFRLGIGA